MTPAPVAIITGASRGLGLALTRRFVNEGWRVHGISRHAFRRPRMPLSGTYEFADSRQNLSGMTWHKVDVTSELQVRRFAQKIHKKEKRIDLLINNAGYGGKLLRTEETPLTEYRKIMDGNLLSAFLMCKYFVPVFRRQKKGFIMNVSSMAGQRAVPRLAIYSASKFGVLALSQAVAKENHDFDFKCLTVCPGGMNTEMRSSLFGPEDAARQQSVEFVARTIFDVYQNKIEVESGGDIVIRHGKITAIHPSPEA